MSRRLRGLGRALWSTWRYERASPGERTAVRARRLAQIVASARRDCPFYAERYAGLPDGELDPQHLPPVTKEELMSRFDDWVADPAVRGEGLVAFLSDPGRAGEPFLGRYLVTRTSGSTGGRAVLIQDPGALTAYAAAYAVRTFGRWLSPRQNLRLLVRGLRLARVIAVGDHFATLAYSEFYRRGGRRRRTISILDPLHEQVAALNEFRPTVFTGYPTGLQLLARERAEGRLSIDPEILVSASERLDPEVRREIEAAFGAPVRNVYAAAEQPALAFDCPRGRLHLNEDLSLFEPVDDRLEPVPPGEPSTGVLLTNLVNRVQPVIRYLLTDSVTVDPEPCDCGGTLPVVHVDARSRQILTLRQEDGGKVRVLPIALVTVAERIGGLDRYQIVQTRYDVLRIRMAPRAGAESDAVWRALRDGLRDHLAGQGLANVRVERDPEPPRRDAGGKFHKVWSE